MPARSSAALLHRFTTLLVVVLAATWAVLRWAHSPSQAIGGSLLVLLAGPLILGIEFILLAAVARQQGPAVPRVAALVRAWVGEAIQLYRVFHWRQPFRWRQHPDLLQGQARGVVFIHGFLCNRGFWAPWLERLQARGRPYVAVNLEPPFAELDTYAASIEDAVTRLTRATGQPPLLVCHSMGGLAARAWLRAAADPGRVSGLVTIGSPHRGTWLGRFSRRANGRQMRLASSWLADITRHELANALPPTVCWYSDCDNIVFPTDTARLPGADNRLVPGLAHVALAFEPRVIEETLAMLDAGVPVPAR